MSLTGSSDVPNPSGPGPAGANPSGAGPADGIGQFAGVVQWMRDLTPDIKHVRIVLRQPARIAFHPGQTIRLQIPTPAGQKEVVRNYSFANPPEDDRAVELCIRYVGGPGTTYIFHTLQAGDQVQFRGPFGRFGLSGGQGPMIWIAGGSGVSPFWSMLRHMLNRGLRRDCRFFLGAARKHDLALREELELLQTRLDWLRFIPVVAEPGGEDWTGAVGLVTQVVDRQVAPGDPAEAYVCGPPGLIDAAVKVLATKGFGPERIFMDKFLTHEPVRPA